MEASVAAQAGGDAGQQGGEGAQEGQQGPDFAQFAAQLEANTGSLEEMRGYLEQAPWQQQEQGQDGEEGDGEEIDLSFLDAGDPGFDPEQVAERLGGLIDAAAERRTQQAIEAQVKPLSDQVQQMQQATELQNLVDEFPEIGEPEVAESVVRTAQQVAQAHGSPELASQTWFLRMTYMAARAAEHANQEGGDQPSAAHLEGGAGARPGGSQGDMGDAIVAARGGKGALPF